MPSFNPANKPHAYQRFIPREEVQAFTAWEFTPMDTAAEAAAQAASDQAQAEAATPAPTEPPIDLEAERAQAYDDGFEQGRLLGVQETTEALQEPLQRQLETHNQRLQALLQQAQRDLDQLQAGLATQVLELACDVARQVVRRELRQPLDSLHGVVQEALALLVAEGQPATLKLHPGDLELFAPTLGEQLQQQGVKLLPDASLTPGGCTLEAIQGAVDATVEKRWARAVANLGLELPWDIPTPEPLPEPTQAPTPMPTPVPSLAPAAPEAPALPQAQAPSAAAPLAPPQELPYATDPGQPPA
jgi:flagellar assembly protein FliH